MTLVRNVAAVGRRVSGTHVRRCHPLRRQTCYGERRREVEKTAACWTRYPPPLFKQEVVSPIRTERRRMHVHGVT